MKVSVIGDIPLAAALRGRLAHTGRYMVEDKEGGLHPPLFQIRLYRTMAPTSSWMGWTATSKPER
jgi:hypothetical protein